MHIIQLGKHTIEAPCHQLLDYEEHDDCCDIILDRYYPLLAAEVHAVRIPRLTYIVAVLNVEKAPEASPRKSSYRTIVLVDHIHRHNGIDDGEAPIER